MNKITRVILGITILMAFIGTSLGLTSIAVKNIKLNTASVKLSIGKTYRLKVTFTPANATNKRVIFSSGNKSIATVSSTGYIKGIKAGKTIVTVTSASNSKAVANCTVTIITSRPKEQATINWILGGDEHPRTAAIKNKILQELNVKLNIIYEPWGNYFGKLDLMLAAGEQLDLFWHGSTMASYFNSKKSVQPINEALNKYGSNIRRVIPKENFEFLKVDGNIMGIPSQYAPSASKFSGFVYRKDLADEVGVKEIKTLQDLMDLGDKVKQKYPDMTVTSGSSWSFSQQTLPTFEGDKNYTFADNDLLLLIDQDTREVISYYESEIFKKHCELMKQWNKKGYIPMEQLTDITANIPRFYTGKYVFSDGAITRPIEDTPAITKNIPTAKLAEVFIPNNKIKYITMPGNEGLYIPYNSRVADRVIMFLDWIWANQENYDFITLGTEGKDYKMENGKYTLLNNNQLFVEWQLRNVNYMKYPSYVDENYIATFKNWDKNSKYSIAYGFTFDQEPVKAELARIKNVIGEKFLPMATGFTSYETQYSNALEALKNADFGKYLTEYKKQFNEFLNRKRK